MKFRTKILLAIWSVVLGLLIVTYIIINYWIRVQVESRFADDLRSNYRTVRELENLREGELLQSGQVVAETPRLKAVVEINDRNTTEQLCRELNTHIGSDLFILTGTGSQIRIELLNGQPINVPFGRLPGGRSSQGVMALGNTAYRYAAVPLVIGPDSVGMLMLGIRLQERDLRSFESMTNSRIALIIDTILDAPSLNSSQRSDITKWFRTLPEPLRTNSAARDSGIVFTIAAPNEKYAAAWYRFDRGLTGHGTGIGMLILKPIEIEVESVLSPVVRTFIVLSLIVLLVTVLIGFIISQEITRPIEALVNGTSEISRGNYDHRIAVGGGGELKFLAQKFEEMSHSLKEKISQLGVRNVELESALQQLQKTQAELIRTERLAVTGRLTAQLAHEINNPIHNIQSLLQTVLRRAQIDSADRELLDVACEEAERLGKLTRQMLDVYRTSMAPLDMQPVHLNDVLQDVSIASEQMLQEKGIGIDLEIDRSLPAISGSPDKLKQVMLNLLINARDAMPRGGRITVHSCRENGMVIIRVTDTGIGIPSQHINRIFDAFFTTKSSVSGVGLGLSVTYGIVRQHDGTITVQSTPGKGSTFTLSFPPRQGADRQ